jgi:hypothetical protein
MYLDTGLVEFKIDFDRCGAVEVYQHPSLVMAGDPAKSSSISSPTIRREFLLEVFNLLIVV